ncbi:MAG: hypothetical protein K1000chlam2_01696 [Chlamydiae bacterium]|nr:hypothetical protein [Chlamydiota bacterium]
MGNSTTIPVIKPQKPLEPVNFMLLLMKALEKDQTTLSKQEIVDAKTTEFDVKIESAIYKSWNKKLQAASDKIQKAVKHKKSSKVKQYQAQMNVESTESQSNESQQEGSVQAAQGQTQSDASNLQMKAQMAQGVNSILLALSNMLGRIEA